MRTLVRRREEEARGRALGRRLAARLNAAASYEAFCAAALAQFPRDAGGLRKRARREMRRPDGAWRKEYAGTKLVEELLLESQDLLVAGQLSTDAMHRFNAFVECEHVLLPVLGQRDDKYGGRLAWAATARVLPDAPTMARLISRAGGETPHDLWELIAAGSLPRFKRCPQCGRWFVDESKNRTRARCSTACTNRWWSRTRRRAADHRLKD